MGTGQATEARPAYVPLAWISGAVMLALALTATRYGYHRDELYFIAAGGHLAWGYPDQPLFTPLLAHTMQVLAPGSLLALRAPAILASGLTTLVTGLLARELGGGRRAQIVAACCWGAGAVCLVTGHFLTTTTYDVCATAVASLFIARVLRTGDLRLWVPAGAVVGLGLLNKSLVGVVIGAVLLALLALGPRDVFRSRWFALGVALAVLGSLPYGLWQIAHGVPQQQLASSIAGSGDQGGRAGFIPFQFILIGPLLAPVWIAGLWSLLRRPRNPAARCFAVAFLALFPIFIASGGKAYYTAGLFPVLLAAGAVRIETAWTGRLRTALLAGAIGLTAAISAVIGLAILPAKDLQGSVVMALNPDTGEMVGWPRFIASVNSVYRSLGPAERRHAVIFTNNYGEAGAVAHFGPSHGLPYPYSGHNGWALWGPPPDSKRPAVLVGIDPFTARRYFRGCRLRRRVNNGIRLENDEQGEPIWSCIGERGSWSSIWDSLRHYD